MLAESAVRSPSRKRISSEQSRGKSEMDEGRSQTRVGKTEQTKVGNRLRAAGRNVQEGSEFGVSDSPPVHSRLTSLPVLDSTPRSF